MPRLIIHLSLLFLSIVIFCSFETAEADINDGLVANWRFDDRNNLGFDSSGNNHHGTFYGTPEQNFTPYGINNGSLVLTSANDGILIPQHTEFNVNYITISFWFKKTSSTTGVIISKDVSGASGCNEWQIYYSQDTGGVHFSMGSCGYAPNPWPPNAILEINNGEWNHFAYVIDPVVRKTAKVFFNGEVVDEVPVTYTGFSLNSAPISIGGYTPADSYMNAVGQVDDLRIYNRPLLDLEIQTLYQSYSDGQDCATLTREFDSKTGNSIVYSTKCDFKDLMDEELIDILKDLRKDITIDGITDLILSGGTIPTWWITLIQNTYDAITDPVFIMPACNFFKNKSLLPAGDYAVYACPADSTSVIVLLNFLKYPSFFYALDDTWHSLDVSWGPLYLGTTGKKQILTANEIKSLNKFKNYIIVPKFSADTSPQSNHFKHIKFSAQLTRKPTEYTYAYDNASVEIEFDQKVCTLKGGLIPVYDLLLSE